MPIPFPSGYIRTTNEPLDYLYLNNGFLWASVAAATNAVTGLNPGIRYIGQFVNIDDGFGGSELYWFKDGITNGDLVPFSAGGSGTYTGASPTTVVVENYPIGTAITGLSYNALFENIYAPYVTPTLPTFSASFGNLFECGDNYSATSTATFNFTVTNLANVVPNTLSIVNVTQNIVLTNGQPVTSPINTVLLAPYPFSLNVFGTNQWGAKVQDSLTLSLISSVPYTATWAHRMWYGSDISPNLANSSAIQSLQGTSLNATETIPGNYFVPALAAGYKYFCWEDTIPFDPNINTGFLSGGLPVNMATVADDPNYNNTTPNGWSYALVSYSNGTATSNYRVFRTQNPLGGAMTIQIS